MPLIKILIAMRHEAFILGFADLLRRQYIEVLGYCITSDKVKQLYYSLNPDIILIDTRMYPTSSFEVMKEILDLNNDAKIIGVSSTFYYDEVVTLREVGAKAYMLRSYNFDSMCRIIRAVQDGKQFR